VNKEEIRRMRKRKPESKWALLWRIPLAPVAIPYLLYRYMREEQRGQVHEIVCIWPERGRRKWQR
jgi:hypothetical protein